MRIRKIIIDNYKSFQSSTSIEFPPSLGQNRIFLIGGMNGAGKTSVLESINISLYGAKSDFIYKSINRRGFSEGNSAVSFELFLELDKNDEIQILRNWNAGAILSPKPKDFYETLVVKRNGRTVCEKNNEIGQDYINALIPKGITQFFFFDGEKIQEIAADDHSEVRLKSSLEVALGIKLISRLADDIIRLKQQHRKTYIEVSDEDINFKESELKREQANLIKKKKEREELSNELETFKKQNNELKKRFQAAFNSDPKSAEDLRKIERDRIILASKKGKLEEQVKMTVEKHLPLALAGEVFNSLKEQIDNERSSSLSKAINEQALRLANQIIYVLDHPTPIFTQTLKEEQKKILLKRVFDVLSESDSTKISFSLNLSERDAAKVYNKMEEIELSDVHRLKDLIDEINEIEQSINIIKGLDFGNSTDSEKILFDELQQQMESCQNQMGKLSIRIQNLNEEVLLAESLINKIESELSKLYNKHSQSNEKVLFFKQCDLISILLNEFNIKLKERKIHVLQEKTFEMYKLLYSKGDFLQNLEINHNTYELILKDRSGNLIRKSGLSAGEKEILAVSLLWGLAQTSQLNLPILIDTPLSRLDSKHRDNIVQNYFPNAAEQVIILSTDTEIDNHYFKLLEPYLSGAGKLVFDPSNEITIYQDGYFWN